MRSPKKARTRDQLIDGALNRPSVLSSLITSFE